MRRRLAACGERFRADGRARPRIDLRGRPFEAGAMTRNRLDLS